MNKKITELPINLRTIDTGILIKKLEEDMQKRSVLGDLFEQEKEHTEENDEEIPFISTKMQNDSLHKKMLKKYVHSEKRNKLLRR